MPGATWSLAPTDEQRSEIQRLLDCLDEAEEFYTAHGGKPFPFRGCEDAIRPEQYLDFLAHAYNSYEERNAVLDLHRAHQFHHDSPVRDYPKLPAAPLTVIPYFMRSRNGNREYGLPGVRCGYDHIPGVFVIENSIKYHGKVAQPRLRDVAIARSIPEKLHERFHKENRDLPSDPYEAAELQMLWYRDRLGELGYSEHAVNASEASVHAQNEKLGVYSLKDPESRIYMRQPWDEMRGGR